MLTDDVGVRFGERPRQRHLNIWLGIWGLVFFIGATVWTNHLDNHFTWLRSHGIHTTAVVTAIHCSARGGCGDYGWVSFATPLGERSAKIGLNESSGLRPGDRMPIAYNPQRPSDARSLDRNASLPMGELFGVIAYLLALALWITAAARAWSGHRRQQKLRALRRGAPVTATDTH